MLHRPSSVCQVMILELCQHVQGFLHAHNVPPPSSFYEQMLLNQLRQSEEVQRQQVRQQEILRKREQKQVRGRRHMYVRHLRGRFVLQTWVYLNAVLYIFIYFIIKIWLHS